MAEILARCPQCEEIVDLNRGGSALDTITDPFTGENYDELVMCGDCLALQGRGRRG